MSNKRKSRQRPAGWLAGLVVVGFLGLILSIIVNAIESEMTSFAWMELHAMQTFGAYLGWLIALAPVELLARKTEVDLNPLAGPDRNGINVPVLALWIAVASAFLALRGHGWLFIGQSGLGAMLASLTVLYPRATLWHARRRVVGSWRF